MKDRIEATLSAIAEAEEAMIRARILVANLQIPMATVPTHSVVVPNASLKDEPPSRPA